ncbi:glycosyltransferase family 4 protein [Pseudonocardia acaciae]|uniref:glycosyltransferase family 4 protein n=1 Tax=Pseudonocardia acaciae TaxID=551276 RepID=UPI000A01FF53|nr:glycosyltransferase family 4 protein [Pseudonocardia acaciae]
MRIVYIHQYFVTPSMPGGTRSYEQARRLAAAGHDVHVITTCTEAARASLRWTSTVEDGVTVHWLPLPYSNHMRFRSRIGAFLRFAVLATAKAVRLGADVVFATSTPLTVAIPGIVAAKVRRARFVFEVRDLWPELPIELGALRNPAAVRAAFALARAAYRNADHVVALSPGMAEGVAAHGFPPSRMSVVPNGADLDLFASAASEGRRWRAAHDWLGERPLVAYIGTFGMINGVGYLVRLAAALAHSDPDVRFLLVGDGAEADEVRALAAELGVLDRSLFILPEVPKDQVPAVLGAASIATSVVIPTPGLNANSANKFFDAMAAGRPIAINHGGWQADVLRESGAGLALDPHDIDAAAAELVTHLRDGAWLERAGRASHELATTRFGRDILFETLHTAVTGAGARAEDRAGAATAGRPGR